MAKFITSRRNPYSLEHNGKKTEISTGTFIPRTNAKTTQLFRDNTTNTTGRKVTFKHV